MTKEIKDKFYIRATYDIIRSEKEEKEREIMIRVDVLFQIYSDRKTKKYDSDKKLRETLRCFLRGSRIEREAAKRFIDDLKKTNKKYIESTMKQVESDRRASIKRTQRKLHSGKKRIGIER